jgi:hypothetical protein
MNGAAAGAAAAAIWAAQQPLDKKVFGSEYDDVELLGKLATRGSFGAIYSLARPFAPGPPTAVGALAGLSEHLAFWPLGVLVDRYHPARSDLEPLWRNRRAFAQATWRHLLFGVVMGELERRLNAQGEFEPLEDVPVASNGHGNIEHAAAGATGAEAR